MIHLQTEPQLFDPSSPLCRRPNQPARTPRKDAAVNPLIRVLRRYDASDQHGAADILDAVSQIHEVKNRHRFPLQPSTATAHVLVAGWGFHSQLLRNGARQIIDVVAPGDFCYMSVRDEGFAGRIEACGPARVASLNVELLPEQQRALIYQAQQAQQRDMIQRLRARLVSLGRRDARERLAYLIAEAHARLAAVSPTQNNGFDWPFTQEHLADILGLTPVHINRVLGRLRDEGLLAMRNRHVAIFDLEGLRRVGGFEARPDTIVGSDNDLF